MGRPLLMQTVADHGQPNPLSQYPTDWIGRRIRDAAIPTTQGQTHDTGAIPDEVQINVEGRHVTALSRVIVCCTGWGLSLDPGR